MAKPSRKISIFTSLIKPSGFRTGMDDRKETPDQDWLYVMVDGAFVKLYYDEIDYIEGYYNRSIVYARRTCFVLKINFDELCGQLPSDFFCRVHPLFLISLSRVSELDNQYVYLTNKQLIPLGTNYRTSLLKKKIPGLFGQLNDN